jgi:MFS family permease
MVSSYWVVYGVKVMGLTEIQWGIVLLIASVANVILLIPAGIIVDRFGPRRVLTFTLILGAAPIMLFPFLPSFISVVTLFILITLTNSFLMAGAPSFMTQVTPEDKRGRIMSALGQGMLFVNIRGGGAGGPGMGAILVIPTILGSLIGGFVYNYNPVLLWLFYGASLLLSAFISWTFLK